MVGNWIMYDLFFDVVDAKAVMAPLGIRKKKHIIMLIMQLKMNETIYFVYLVGLVAWVLNKQTPRIRNGQVGI